MPVSPIDLAQLLQGSGISLIIGYLGIKELVRFMQTRNGNDPRETWRKALEQHREMWDRSLDDHRRRFKAIEDQQNSMDKKLDIIIASLLKG